MEDYMTPEQRQVIVDLWRASNKLVSEIAAMVDAGLPLSEHLEKAREQNAWLNSLGTLFKITLL
jgi:hypothetical protein